MNFLSAKTLTLLCNGIRLVSDCIPCILWAAELLKGKNQSWGEVLLKVFK